MPIKIVTFGTCPVHGLIQVEQESLIARPEITTGPMCVACKLEFLKEHVTQCVNVHQVHVEVGQAPV